jgi:hypothetical protein
MRHPQEETYHPYVHVIFKGDWSDPEQDKLCQSLRAAETYMPASRRRKLKGNWLATANESEDNRYLAVHRLGIGAAFTGADIDALTRQIEQRWPEPRRELVG